MKIIRMIKEMQDLSFNLKQEGKTIGFVPTMGFLHEGHVRLVRAAKLECDVTVVSIFVNPAQFCPGEDFDKYPRDEKKDLCILEKESVDIVFIPETREMYPDQLNTFVETEGSLTENLCGRTRPGHFKGVTTIVAKLLNVVLPDVAYFGQKDAQQAIVITRMIKDLNFPVKMRVMPIVREMDGLAMSSRNIYLLPEEREQATSINKALSIAEKMFYNGENESSVIKKTIIEQLNNDKNLKIDYVEIVDTERLEPVSTIETDVIIAIAAVVGETRLIDNVIVRSS